MHFQNGGKWWHKAAGAACCVLVLGRTGVPDDLCELEWKLQGFMRLVISLRLQEQAAV